ncbi:unnamed protein product [Arabidopsis halleri]
MTAPPLQPPPLPPPPPFHPQLPQLLRRLTMSFHPLPVVSSLLFCLDSSLSLLFLQLTLSPSSRPMIFPEIRHRGPPVSLAIVTLIRFHRLLSKRE